MIRPVNLQVTPQAFVERMEIEAVPDLAAGTAEVRIRAVVRNAGAQVQKASLAVTVRRDGISDEALRQRVHGVVDVFDERKPSFDASRLQASPVESAELRKFGEGKYELDVRTRKQVPGYTLRGYSLRWLAYGYDDLPMGGSKTDLPPVSPG